MGIVGGEEMGLLFFTGLDRRYQIAADDFRKVVLLKVIGA